MTERTYLEPMFDTRKSFYNKAVVEQKQNEKVLYSYNTMVAKIVEKHKGYIIPAYAVVYGDYSQTTLRHIKEFLKQNGFKAENKQQILKDYLN